MKLSMISKSFLLGLALLLATSAFAANEGSLQVAEPTIVNGQTLAAGAYEVKWHGRGQYVELNILKGSKVVAKAPARKIELKESFSQDAAVVRKNDDGSRSLSEIQFGGKKYALALGFEQAKADAGDSTTK